MRGRERMWDWCVCGGGGGQEVLQEPVGFTFASAPQSRRQSLGLLLFGLDFPRLGNGYLWSLPPPGLLELTHGDLIICGGMTCSVTMRPALRANSTTCPHRHVFTRRRPKAELGVVVFSHLPSTLPGGQTGELRLRGAAGRRQDPNTSPRALLVACTSG